MLDREGEGFKTWLDLEWANPEPKSDDDRRAVEAFIDKLSQVMKSLSQQKKNASVEPSDM